MQTAFIRTKFECISNLTKLRRVFTSVVFASLFVSSLTHAAPQELNLDLKSANTTYAYSYINNDAFLIIAPNENNIQAAVPIFNSSNHHAYIGVGTERIFDGAALSAAKDLVATDGSDAVIRFNKINRALMLVTGTGDLNGYLRLRWSGSAEIWRNAAAESKRPEQTNILKDPENFRWWKDNVVDERELYESVVYLKSEKLFSHLQSLANRRRMHIVQVDLRNTSDLEKIVIRLQSLGIKLGFLDISNAWQSIEGYPGQTGIHKILAIFQPLFSSGSNLLATSQKAGARVRVNSSDYKEWDYFSIPVNADMVKKFPNLNSFFERKIAESPMKTAWTSRDTDISSGKYSCKQALAGN